VPEKEFLCPKCGAGLELTRRQRRLGFIFASWTKCNACGRNILIRNNMPIIPGERNKAFISHVCREKTMVLSSNETSVVFEGHSTDCRGKSK